MSKWQKAWIQIRSSKELQVGLDYLNIYLVVITYVLLLSYNTESFCVKIGL